MPTTISRRSLLAGMASIPAVALLSGCGSGAPSSSNQLVWSTWGVGTGTYNDLAAIANTLTGETGRQIRLMTADTGIGRVAPLINGTAQYARTGDEYYLSFEGNDEFASEQWGPQPIRQVWTPPGHYGVLVRDDSGIKTPADLKGRKYPRLAASPSINRKLEAVLNFGGLTWADVEPVDIGFSAQVEGIKTGQVDAILQNVVGAHVEELASQYPIQWLDLGSEDSARYQTWEDLAPMVRPAAFSEGAGLEDGESVVNMQFTIPMVTLDTQPKDEVYRLVSAMDEYFDSYKNSTADAKYFDANEILMDPLVVPFHDGVIQFLEEKGRWTRDLQNRNDALIERESLMADEWPSFWDRHSDQDQASDEWVAWKRENLPPLPSINDLPDDSAVAGFASSNGGA